MKIFSISWVKEKIAEIKFLPNMQGGEIVGTPEENVKIRKNILKKINFTS